MPGQDGCKRQHSEMSLENPEPVNGPVRTRLAFGLPQSSFPTLRTFSREKVSKTMPNVESHWLMERMLHLSCAN
jgi:hypothetical protein